MLKLKLNTHLPNLAPMKQITLLIIFFGGFLLGLPATCDAAFDDLGPYFSFTWGDGGGIPSDVNNVTSQQTSADGQNVTLSGSLGPIDGARFADGFVLYWAGGFQGTINPGDQFTADLNFDVTATGGSLAWNYYSDLWSNEGFESARILTDTMPVPLSGQVNNVQLVSSAFTQPGQTGQLEGYLYIDWSGFGPTDTFSIGVNSIDVSYLGVPEPNPLPPTLAALLAFLLLRFCNGLRVTMGGQNSAHPIP
jgi:hypothetical protein